MMQIDHGGALDRAVLRFGGEPTDWLDLSTGINPEIFPMPRIRPEVWSRLPDQALLVSAIESARAYYGAGSEAGIVAASGTQALIQILPELAVAGEVAILGPTYQEHEVSFRNAGWKISHCSAVVDIPSSAKVAVIVNPNNPDGRITAAGVLLDLAKELHGRGGFLIVDEAFADPHPEVSIAARAGMDGLVVLKSFGKFFGLGGLRLGFALTDQVKAQRLAERLGPWAVAGPALAIAAHAFSDEKQLAGYALRLENRRKLLTDVLAAVMLPEIGGTMLFSLVRFDRAHLLYDRLCEQWVLTRKFSYAPQWLRFGLPLDARGADQLHRRLVLALGAVQS